MSRAQQFGRYELLDRVNVGGMAEIFRALDKQSGAVCAVKRILPEIADDEEFIRMFRDEAKIVGQLEHPNICRILELGRVDHDWFLAMQFVEGLDLRAIFDRAIKRSVRLELPFLLHVFMKVCEGLEYAHRKRDAHGRPLNVVHRDVSPQNVLVGFNGDVKVIDFGIAKSNGKLSKTQVGTIKGKYGYMSPEQVRGLPLDHRSDLFSFGICMYELLTQKRLFASDNELLTMERIKEAEFASPRAIEPSIPKTVEQIVLRALARDVTDRYASAADLYADLQAFAYSEGLVWGKDAVADYMQRTFGDGAAKPSPTASHNGRNGALNHATSSAGALPSEPMSSSRRVQENAMSDKGSDLDVFEGLTSKRGTNRPPNSAAAPPPPPPPSRASVPPPPPPGTRRQMATQMGMGLPPMPSVPGAPRTSTPPIAPPPSRQSAGGAPPPPSARNAPPPPAPPPSAQARGAMVDMDWDDEDEKTHVYDKDIVGNAFGPMTSKGVGPMPAPLPPPSHPGPKATMMGMAAPLPPPRTSDRPVPPPPPSRSSRGVPPPPAPPPSKPMMAAPPPPAPPPQSHPLAATQNTGGAPFPQTMVAPMTAPMPAPAPQPINAPPPQVAPAAPARPVADATQVIKAKGGGNAGLIVGALVLAAAAGVGAFFWMSSRPGNVLVNVEVKGPKGTKVSVSLDGAEKCADSTCRIEGVTPGAHTVKAVAGDVEKKATINVEPGKDAIANLTLEVASKKTGVKLASSQTGIKVEIDGGSPRALPVEDDTLKSGEHTLKFTGPGGRYGTKELKITLEDGQMKTLDDVKLPLKSVKTKFVFLTKGTKAFLDDGTKKSELKDDGQPIELDTTKSYTVTATAPGHEDFSKKIEFGDEPDQAVKLELNEKGKAAAPTPPTPTPTPGPIAVAPKPTPTPTPTPAAGGEGSLFVNTLPASACVVDGTPRGKTPFTIKLSPGSHSIMCVAKDGDETLKKSASANVNAGETAKVILKLRD